MSESHSYASTRWMEHAACREADPELFFPPHKTNRQQSSSYRLHVVEALDVCAICPVQINCLEFAIKDPSLRGIWGGSTDQDRGRIRRARKRQDPLPACD